ncbi:MAG: orotidine-5'-phosphate decarboxylase [Tannerellaceae bacterium]|jgi:orotidine-5'-phosphate decarboxylase|nr:orotidine-5'-phosphate decarboxylase [Tannerellaceae bacterium]
MTKQQLFEHICRKQSFLCIGLDTDLQKIPPFLLAEEDPAFAFNKNIIDATAPHCVAYKPNLAFYESRGAQGLRSFEKTVAYLKEHYPDQFVIADAKRGDIGNTSGMYARSFFEHMKVDAVTVAPYMGEDSVKPFLQYPESWVVLLALTSNKGSLDFQMTESAGGERLFEKVLRKSQEWATDEQMMYVAGATQGELLRDVRRQAPHHFLLVPGIGAQGGSLKEVAEYGMNEQCGLLVNSSRAIIYAATDASFAEAARREACAIQQEMALYLSDKRIIPGKADYTNNFYHLCEPREH